MRTGWIGLGVVFAALGTGRIGTAEDAPTAGWKDGFYLASDDGEYKLRLTGYAQLDGRFFPGDPAEGATDTFVLRRARPMVQGTLAGRFDFCINPDFGGGSSVLQDAYLDARFAAWLRLRAGKFKTPFGIERLQSAAQLWFVERALPSDIVPNRDLGVQLHGELADGVASYALGAFNGVPDGGSLDLDANDGKEVAARLFVKPFAHGPALLRRLGFGVAGTLGEQQGALASYRTPGQRVFFGYVSSAAADGSRWRLSPQASYQLGALRLLGEYVRSSTRVRNGSEAARVANQAWQAALAFVVTGEEPQALGAVVPRQRFDPEHGGWGALELAARVSSLDVGAEAFDLGFADAARSARRALAWGVGVNWYLNRNVKLVANFERTTFEGGGKPDRENENALLFRSQIAF